MAWGGSQVSVTASAVKLTTAVGAANMPGGSGGGSLVSGGAYARQIDVFAKSTNTGHVFLGPSTVTNVPANARVDLAPGTGYSFVPGGQGLFVHTDEIFIVGTASDVAFISIVG